MPSRAHWNRLRQELLEWLRLLLDAQDASRDDHHRDDPVTIIQRELLSIDHRTVSTMRQRLCRSRLISRRSRCGPSKGRATSTPARSPPNPRAHRPRRGSGLSSLRSGGRWQQGRIHEQRPHITIDSTQRGRRLGRWRVETGVEGGGDGGIRRLLPATMGLRVQKEELERDGCSLRFQPG